MLSKLIKFFQRLRGRISLELFLLLAAICICLSLFIDVAEEVYEKEGFPVDQLILSHAGNRQHPVLNFFFQSVTITGSMYVLGPAALAICLTLISRRRYREAILVSSGLIGAALIAVIAKHFFARNRPELFPHLSATLSDFSFPSSHTTQSAAFWFSVFLACRYFKPEWQKATLIIGLVLTFCVACSRVYLQVHYPSDVLAGLLVAVIWVCGVYGITVYRKPSEKMSQ